MDTQKRELVSLFDKAEAQLHIDYKKQLDTQIEDSKNKSLKFQQDLESLSDKLKRESAIQISDELKLQESLLNQEKENELSERDKQHAGAIAQLKATHDKDYKAVSNELKEIDAKFNDSMKKLVDMKTVLDEEMKLRQSREDQFLTEKSQLARQNETELSRQKEVFEKKMTEAFDRMQVEIQVIKQEFHEERSRFEDKFREIQKAYAILDSKYKNRDSRPEDLEAIARLEREMVEKDELVAKTKDEMMYFKREMLNREDNYNSKFNAKPVVGVMQVIKGKDKDGDNKTSGAGSGAGLGLGLAGGAGPSSNQGPGRTGSGGSQSQAGGLGGGMGIGGSSVSQKKK